MVVKVEVFTSDSCPHCPMAVQVAEEAKKEIDGIDVEIVNIGNSENRQRAIDYQIMAVPTIVIEGNVDFIGAPTKDELVTKLKSYLS